MRDILMMTREPPPDALLLAFMIIAAICSVIALAEMVRQFTVRD